jgi:hypothetical protein
VVPGRAHRAKRRLVPAAADEVDGMDDRAGRVQRGVDGMRIERGVGVEVAQPAGGRRRLDRRDVAAIVHACELVRRRRRRLLPHEVRLEAGRDELVVDRGQPVGALGVIRAHFVLQAGGMGDEGGRGHDGFSRDGGFDPIGRRQGRRRVGDNAGTRSCPKSSAADRA